MHDVRLYFERSSDCSPVPRHEVGLQLVEREHPVTVDKRCRRASSSLFLSVLKARVLVLERELIVVVLVLVLVYLADVAALGREKYGPTKLAHAPLPFVSGKADIKVVVQVLVVFEKVGEEAASFGAFGLFPF